MNLDLAARTAVVTGASRGIGLATVRTLISEGVRVVGAARTITPELKDSGAFPVSVDLGTPEGAAALMEQASAELGGVDFVVNNVGNGDAMEPAGFLEIDEARWKDVFDVNLLSAVRVSRAALPGLIERRGGIVNVSSIVARQPSAGTVDYSAAKAALVSFGKSLAEEFGPLGVRVNTVTPGPTRTPAWEEPGGFGSKLAAASGSGHAEFLRGLPGHFGITTGRMTEAEEVAALIVFLLSDVAGNITGADHVIDGGLLKGL
ncbi:SDR family oxidoreductase [Actinocorallia sp. B10E7]|uniref:SDR family NAD(P)-dependent oxidoreductase n=1 Tax=Actinocorallia sp. B10E7 TaxID=3153558 RepID=UPI00325E1506